VWLCLLWLPCFLLFCFDLGGACFGAFAGHRSEAARIEEQLTAMTVASGPPIVLNAEAELARMFLGLGR
jgi:hypothetical protein